MKSNHCYTLSQGIKPFPVSLLLLSYLIILSISFVDAQTASDSTPSSTVVDDGGDYELEGKRVNPSMAIIIIVLVLGFFITGCISIYVQQCSEDSREAQVVGQPMRAVQRGVDQSVIDTYPTFLYSDVKELKIGKGALECAICITEFEEDETLRLLPVCDHVFHPECIDAWLSAHATCPVCRANLVADTGELSKAEVRDDDDDHSESTPSDHHHLVEVAVEAEPPKGRVPRSHSTGHSLVRVIRPSEDRERFTLRLTDEVRKQLMVARPMLKRTTSLVALPRVSSSRRGYRGGGEGSGSSRYGRFFGRWTTKHNGGDGDGSTGSKRFSRTAVTPMEALPRLPV